MSDREYNIDEEQEEIKLIFVVEIGTGKSSLINIAIRLIFQEKLFNESKWENIFSEFMGYNMQKNIVH